MKIRYFDGFFFKFSCFQNYSSNDESVIEWPAELGEYGGFENVIPECNGLCGEFTLDNTGIDFEPFVGVGFGIARVIIFGAV